MKHPYKTAIFLSHDIPASPHHPTSIPTKVHQLRDPQVALCIRAKGFEDARPRLELDVQILK